MDTADKIATWLQNHPGEHSSRDIFHATRGARNLPYNQTATALRHMADTGRIQRRKQVPDEVLKPTSMHKYTGWRWVYSAKAVR